MSLCDVEDIAGSAAAAKRVPSGPMADTSCLTDADRALPPYAQRGRLHNAACDQRLEGYIDPITEEVVPSAYFLRQRDCCGDKCRHCPYNFKNVPKQRSSSVTSFSTSSSSPASQDNSPPTEPPRPAVFLDGPVGRANVRYEFPPTVPPATEPLTVDMVFSAEELAAMPSYAVKGRLHRKAVELKYDSYILPSDPTVAIFSSVYLARQGTCCAQRCNHCPYNYNGCRKAEGADETSSTSSSSSSTFE